jgi:hypothetical protein
MLNSLRLSESSARFIKSPVYTTVNILVQIPGTNQLKTEVGEVSGENAQDGVSSPSRLSIFYYDNVLGVQQLANKAKR